MTKFDLFDSIGNVDDELIEKAVEPKKSGKKAFRAITSVAACAVLACAAVLIVSNINNSNNVVVDPGVSSAVGTSSYKPVDDGSSENKSVGGESSETHELEYSETPVEQIPIEMYKIENGKLVHHQLLLDADPQTVFNVWKSENYVGEEVKLINVKIEDNGTDTVSDYSGVEVATHKVGDHTVYILTITKNLEKYYDSTGKELLLDSLEKTMTGMCDPKPDEYQLILSDNAENEQSQIQSSASDDKQNSDDFVNSDTYTEPSPANPGTKGSFDDEASSGISHEYTPDESVTEQPSSNYTEESESNHVDPDDIQYNDQGEILE